MRWWIVGVTVLGLGAGACGSKGGSTTPSAVYACAPDAATWVPVPLSDAGVVTANVALPCPVSISDYCYYVGGCPPRTWAAAVALQNTTGLPFDLYTCNPYDWADSALVCNEVSTSSDFNTILFAFDKTTGALVGAVEVSSPGSPFKETCLAGPATIAPFGSCTAVYNCNPNDAGLPRGDCYGDGGIDGAGRGG